MAVLRGTAISYLEDVSARILALEAIGGEYGLPFDQYLEMMPPSNLMDSIDPLWIIDINRHLLQGLWRIAWEAGKGGRCPQGCVDLVFGRRIWVIVKPVDVSSHDIDRSQDIRKCS